MLGIYVHVPFCASRCGYCDFNTYVPGSPSEPGGFVAAALLELGRARSVLGERPVDTVFIGGGTPSLLGADGLLRLLDGIASRFPLPFDVEVTTEANPESVDPAMLRALVRGGFTRISLGMQSAAPAVLRTLDRMHTPGRAVAAAREAREAGFSHVSLDLIYGTPGETDEDWRKSLDAALSASPDHISAYGLTVEPGTAMAASVRSGRLPEPDDGDQARRFLIAEERLSAAGFDWYELCSWARNPEARCRHNLGYWSSGDWWGIGPGAHSHLAGERWWNVRLPARYAARLAAGEDPAAGRELLSEEDRDLEAVMLGLRVRGGLDLARLSQEARQAALLQAEQGRLQVAGGRAELTVQGRLFADAVVREIVSA